MPSPLGEGGAKRRVRGERLRVQPPRLTEIADRALQRTVSRDPRLAGLEVRFHGLTEFHVMSRLYLHDEEPSHRRLFHRDGVISRIDRCDVATRCSIRDFESAG